MNCKLLLFDLDGTLLQTDKTISRQTDYFGPKAPVLTMR